MFRLKYRTQLFACGPTFVSSSGTPKDREFVRPAGKHRQAVSTDFSTSTTCKNAPSAGQETLGERNGGEAGQSARKLRWTNISLAAEPAGKVGGDGRLTTEMWHTQLYSPEARQSAAPASLRKGKVISLRPANTTTRFRQGPGVPSSLARRSIRPLDDAHWNKTPYSGVLRTVPPRFAAPTTSHDADIQCVNSWNLPSAIFFTAITWWNGYDCHPR